MNTEQVIRDAEAQLALAKLVNALRTAKSCTIRKSAEPMSSNCEVVLAATENDAQAIFEAIKNAAKHI